MSEQEQPDDDSQKTEEPTPRRREEAERKGQMPISREINTVFMLLAATLIVYYASPLVSSGLSLYLKQFLEKTDQITLSWESVKLLSINGFLTLCKWLFMPFCIILFCTVMGTGLQTRFKIKEEGIQLQLSRISPLQGFKRMFSMSSVVELAKGILKISIVAGALFYLMIPAFKNMESTILLHLDQVPQQIRLLSTRMLVAMMSVLGVIAVLDYLYQRQQFLKGLRMSRHDIKKELRETEGDPQIRAKIRQIRMDRARRRMISTIPKATVVITNPTHYAVALEYNSDTMDAPKLIAKGQDFVAQKIREMALEHYVPIVQNPPLAQTLYKELDLDAEILPQHYKAVAEVIQYVMRLKEERTHH